LFVEDSTYSSRENGEIHNKSWQSLTDFFMRNFHNLLSIWLIMAGALSVSWFDWQMILA
jgi:hypothetical protein